MNLPQWAQDWIEFYCPNHPPLVRPYTGKHSKAVNAILIGAEMNDLPLAWSPSWVAEHMGASYAEWDAWEFSSYWQGFKARYNKIYDDYRAGKLATNEFAAKSEGKGRASLESCLREYAVERARSDHPGLWDLGQRYLTRRPTDDDPYKTAMTEIDFDVAEWYLHTRPQIPCNEQRISLPEYKGASQAWDVPIGKYANYQVYVAGKEARIMREKAARRLETLTPSELRLAKENFEKWKDYGPPTSTHPINDPRFLIPPGYPKEYYCLSVACRWGGEMNDEEWRDAAAWFTCLRFIDLLGEGKMPGDEGYEVLPPLQDPFWQGMSTTPHLPSR